ncbi:MAG: cobalamin biosynthesis protein [Nitrosopumilaceae archaeon]
MILIPIFLVISAIIMDLVFGDPRNKFHPTAWTGMLIGKLVPFAKRRSSKDEKFVGIILTILVSSIVATLLYFFIFGVDKLLLSTLTFDRWVDYVILIFSVLVSAFLLKTTFAIKGMERHTQLIMEALSRNDLDDARTKLSMIVKRSTKNLDREHIISGTLESVSENVVDGITGPLFYFAIFGLPGAFVYRTINTLDSMIGYKTVLFRNVGWFSANCDKILNYLPARLTGLMIILAAAILKENWKHSLLILKRDGSKTESPNAGYPMAAMAGALGTRFEKINHYNLGDGILEFTETHYRSAISIMKLSAILFTVVFTIPMITMLSYLGWWLYV